MNIQDYIESGIIETYALGMADAQEAAEFEQLCREYPAVKLALEAFEASLEQQALSHAIPPPAAIKQRLMSELAAEFVHLSAPIISEPAKVVQLNSFSKYAAAASVILLVISGGMNVYFYSKFKETANQYQALVVEKNSLQANNQIMQTKTLDLYNSMQMMTDPTMQKVAMPGIAGKESSYATIFWDMKSKDVYLLPNKLPQAAPGKQYQLWAIVDGKPVDAGMISDCAGLCKMKNIPNASMFAITLEKQGGSASPTLTEMYVAGKVG